MGVESIQSDLDLMVTTFDCLFDRRSFYQAIEKKLNDVPGVEDLIVVWAANIPLAKFSVRGVSVDLVFADFATPKLLPTADYLTQPHNITSAKSAECMLSYLTMLELKRTLQALDPHSDQPLQIFSRVCQVVKCFA